MIVKRSPLPGVDAGGLWMREFPSSHDAIALSHQENGHIFESTASPGPASIATENHS
ncbi:MAG: hypothetical protein ACP5D7_10900 [Limnospira sp.]